MSKSNDYHFITHWRVNATCEEVDAIIGDAEGLSRWWPSVYLDTKVLSEGDPNNVGKRVALYTKGWLPYTLRWDFVIVENRKPNGFTISATGDFLGRGIWTFEQSDNECNVRFDWKLEAEKPILKSLSFILKPLFSFNHRWAMARGEESLKLELLRRRAATEEERQSIPPPPGPTFPHNLTNNKIL